MAYDQQSGYQPAHRAYYGQQQQQRQQAPVQQAYRNGAQQGYDEFGQGSPQEYDQQYQNGNGGYEQGYAQGVPNGGNHGQVQNQRAFQRDGEQGHSNRQNGGNGYDQQGRSYDPRYQHRAMNGGQQSGRDQQASQRNGQQAYPVQPQQQMTDARHRPIQPQDRLGYQDDPTQRPGYGQRNGRPRQEEPQQSYQVQPSQQRPVEQRQQQQQQSYQVQSSHQRTVEQQQQPNGRPQDDRRRPRPEEQTSQQRLAKPAPQPRPSEEGRSDRQRPPQQAPIATSHAIPAPKPEQIDRMAEWKAKEKARMHAAAKSPENMSQDNAFPVFGNPRARQKGHGSTSTRASEDRQRPSTSDSQRPAMETLVEQQPSTSGNRGYVQETAGRNGDYERPPLEHPPASHNGGWLPQHQDGHGYQQFHAQSYANNAGPMAAPPESQWPITNTAPPEQQRLQHDRAPPTVPAQYTKRPQVGNTSQSYAQEAQRPYVERDNGGRSAPPQQPMQGQRRGPPPPIQPIQTNQEYRRPMPAYGNEQQPLSPAVIPQRPATAAGPKPNGSQNIMSPTSEYSDEPQSARNFSGLAQTVESPGVASPTTHRSGQLPYQPQQRTYSNQTQSQERNRKHDTIADVYGQYLDEPPTPGSAPPVPAPALFTRDDEIEAEMPDFDSAAPGQTSSLHKRNQTVDRHLNNAAKPGSVPPPTQVQHVNQSVQSSPASHEQRPRYYQQQSQPQMTSQPVLAQSQQQNGGIAEGFVFGFAGEEAHVQQPQGQAPRQHEMPYRQGPPNGQHMPQQQQQYASQPSVDDGRRPRTAGGPTGPQQPRLDRNGQHVHPRGQYPPQMRPDVRPGQGAQPIWSDPGQQRMGSAPPQVQGLPPPPPITDGGPLQQRHSNPDALPQHPTPVRPGLMQTTSSPQGSQAHPAPVRNYSGGTAPSNSSKPRQASVELPPQPVTHAELDSLRAACTSNPDNPVKGLLLVKKLVEASTVLASENNRLDARATAKNRERYVLDAHKRLKKLVAQNYAEAQFYLADCYGQGALGLEVDTKEAFNLYQAAAKQNHAQAAYRTAVCCEMGPDEGGGTRRDYAKAVQWYKRAATLGDRAAQFKTGMINLKGLLGAPRNVGDAVTWLKRAAEQADAANPHALHELALLHEPLTVDPEIRNKVLPDERYARDLFQRAADYGYKLSQFRLGQAYEYGSLGMKISHRNSIYWYTKAAAQGEHQAELALSGWYLTGAEGVLEHSDHEAYMWARKAAGAEPPFAKALFAMGYFTENGIGCPKSLEEARRWYGRAASYKFPKALERLEELKKSGGKKAPPPANGRLTRKDQRRDEAECTMM